MPASAFPNSTASVSICRSKGWNGRLERNDGEVLEVIAKSSRHPAPMPGGRLTPWLPTRRCVIEVADANLTHDLETKLRLYQQAGITNDWVVAVRHPIGQARSGPAGGVARAGGGPGGRTASPGIGGSAIGLMLWRRWLQPDSDPDPDWSCSARAWMRASSA